jgi:hypothetical protein
MKADNCLTWTYDIETDSLFIYRNEKYDYETSLELNVDVILDWMIRECLPLLNS